VVSRGRGCLSGAKLREGRFDGWVWCGGLLGGFVGGGFALVADLTDGGEEGGCEAVFADEGDCARLPDERHVRFEVAAHLQAGTDEWLTIHQQDSNHQPLNHAPQSLSARRPRLCVGIFLL